MKLFEPPNFFGKYKHFIVLMASTQSKEHHLEWYGLVESKIRILISNLERHPYIAIAHVNTESFPSTEPNGDKRQSMWFIGLQFNKTEHVNIDLTYDTRSFVDTVKRQATAINIFKQDMEVDIKYVRRRELVKYLPQTVLNRCKKKGNKTTSTTPNSTPQHSPGMTSQAGKKALSSSRSDSALLSLVGDGMGSTVGNDIALTSDDSCSSLTVTASGNQASAVHKRKLNPESGEEGNDDDGANKRCRSDEINSAAFMDAIGLGKNSNPDMPFLDCSAADSQLQTDDSSSPLNTSSGTKRHCEDDCEADGEAPKRPKPDSSEKMEEDDNTVSSSSPQRNHVVPEPEPASLGSSASGPESVIALQRDSPKPCSAVTSSTAIEEKACISDGIDSTARSPLHATALESTV
ncbi:hypothetical protein MRX96_031882 [Rhipicephalus microplus]